MNVLVYGMSGRSWSFDVSQDATIRDAKTLIEDESGIPVREQCLLAGLEEPTDGQQLAKVLVDGVDFLTFVRRDPEESLWLERMLNAAIPQDVFRFAPQHVRDNPNVALPLIRKHGYSLKLAGPSLRADRAAVLLAVTQAGAALQFASRDLQADREVVLTAVRQNAAALAFADARLRADREVVMVAVAGQSNALRHASAELRGDADVVSVAALRDATALEHAAEAALNDRDSMAAVVAKHPHALRLVGDALKYDWEFVLDAIEQDVEALKFVPHLLLSSDAFIQKAAVVCGFGRESVQEDVERASGFVVLSN